jgi:hypothetical protein
MLFQMSGSVRLRACWRQLKNRRHVYSLAPTDRPGVVIGVTTAKGEENGTQFALTESGKSHVRYCTLSNIF